MHPRIQEVLDYLDTTRSDVSNAVESVAADRRNERPSDDRWSVAEVLDHLRILEARVAQLVSGRLAAARAAGLGPELETSPIIDTVDRARILDRSHRATAPDFVRPQSACDAGTAWATLQQSRAELRAAVVANDGFALSEVKHEHPVLGLINLYQWLVFVGAHEARHTDQIREIAQGFAAAKTN